MNNLQKLQKEIQEDIKKNLIQCCRELREWDKTAVLPDGEVRRIASTAQQINSWDQLHFTRSMIESAALDYVASLPAHDGAKEK